MKKGDVVLGVLVPAHQDVPETVQPTVRAFHHPAPGFETSLLFDGLCLYASAADVGGEAELLQGAAHLGEVVALIQAQTPGDALGWAPVGAPAGCPPSLTGHPASADEIISAKHP